MIINKLCNNSIYITKCSRDLIKWHTRESELNVCICDFPNQELLKLQLQDDNSLLANTSKFS